MSLKIKGPVLSGNQITLINEIKELEYLVLEKIKSLQNNTEVGSDPRWISTGKTDIEKGFMSLIKGISTGVNIVDGN